MCSITSFPVDPTTDDRFSVYRAGWEEACRFKWYRSEEQHRDVGIDAIRQWVRDHWNGFLRARWVEHLYGRCFWIELDQNDFGLLLHQFQNSPILRPILDQLLSRWENFDVILWALAEEGARLDRARRGEPEPSGKLRVDVAEVIQILEALDVNSRRLEFKVEKALESFWRDASN